MQGVFSTKFVAKIAIVTQYKWLNIKHLEGANVLYAKCQCDNAVTNILISSTKVINKTQINNKYTFFLLLQYSL